MTVITLSLKLTVEQVVRLIYLDRGIPEALSFNYKQLIRLLRRNKKSLIGVLRAPIKQSNEALVVIGFDAMDLSPSDLSIIDKFKV